MEPTTAYLNYCFSATPFIMLISWGERVPRNCSHSSLQPQTHRAKPPTPHVYPEPVIAFRLSVPLGTFPFSSKVTSQQPSSTPAAVALCNLVPSICWMHVRPPFPPHFAGPTASPQPLFPSMSLAKPQDDIGLKFSQGKRIWGNFFCGAEV